jgi:flavin-dependent dehydrogenase
MLAHAPRAPRDRCEETPHFMDTFPDLGSLTDQELKDLIRLLTEEEVDISYKRRILHGKIDILRAELVNRLRKKHEAGDDVITGADVQRLTDILAGRGVEAGDEAE